MKSKRKRAPVKSARISVFVNLFWGINLSISQETD
jgi:hypothetical protein